MSELRIGMTLSSEEHPPARLVELAADVRHDMLAEAVEVMRRLWTGESIVHRGAHYTVEHARIFDPPQIGPDQDGFLRFWDHELRPRLDELRTPAAVAGGGAP